VRPSERTAWNVPAQFTIHKSQFQVTDIVVRMMIARKATEARHQAWPLRLVQPALLIAATATAAYVMQFVALHTIEIVRARHLLPQWDLATHLGHGWLDYHLLATGQIPGLLWDLWLQGYWPPGLSLYQVPFYLMLGGSMASGLWSTPVAFVLIALTGSVLLWRQWSEAALLPTSLFLALLTSSPFLLAYATVTMTEMLGALAQILMLLCYQRYRQSPGPRTARLFAVSMTVLFFVKYNYFLLLAGPLIVYEWLERTSGWGPSQRLSNLSRWTRRVLSSPTGVAISLYIAGLLIIVTTGGFAFQLLGQRVSMRGVGNSGHVVLYLLLGRLWYLHSRGRIDWRRLTSTDPRVRPLLLWFLVPVTIWLASPYPNHIRDFANLVINRPLGDPTVGTGIATYLEAFRTAYFYTDWTLAFVVIAFGVAAAQYRRQPPVMQWLIVAIPLQSAAIVLHQTRFPRFLLLTVVLLCLVAASEAGRWFAGRRSGRLVAGLLAPMVLTSGVVAARHVVTEERFRVVAFEHYTDSEPLRSALDAIRGELRAEDRLLIVGQSNELSPALLRWELGPPSGVPCFPFQIGGEERLDPALATLVLLIGSLGSAAAPIGIENFNPARVRGVREEVDRGDLVLRREFPLEDLQVAFRLYRRATPSLGEIVNCEL
jgi:hypothetical protein